MIIPFEFCLNLKSNGVYIEPRIISIFLRRRSGLKEGRLSFNGDPKQHELSCLGMSLSANSYGKSRASADAFERKIRVHITVPILSSDFSLKIAYPKQRASLIILCGQAHSH